MKTLILYSSKSGASRECAELLAARLGNAQCSDIKSAGSLDDNIGMVVIGAGVRAGRMYKAARQYIEANQDLLLARKLAIYSCNALENTLPEIIKKNIPPRLAEHAIAIESFGGKKPFEKPAAMEWLRREAFDSFVEKVSRALVPEASV